MRPLRLQTVITQNPFQGYGWVSRCGEGCMILLHALFNLHIHTEKHLQRWWQQWENHDSVLTSSYSDPLYADPRRFFVLICKTSSSLGARHFPSTETPPACILTTVCVSSSSDVCPILTRFFWVEGIYHSSIKIKKMIKYLQRRPRAMHIQIVHEII
jgi:hypothetical protein